MHSMGLHSALAIKRQRKRQDMHSMGLHSALAIKRQRKRRDEQRRARERRYSQQSTESGLGESQSSFVSPRSSMRGRTRRRQAANSASDALVESKMVSSVGMLHIGVVFLVLGGFLLGSGLLPEDITSWSSFSTASWWNELTVAGGCAILLGIFLIVLNRIVSKREEDDLTEYVQRQLTRSRSGHRLVRDVETGALTNKPHRARHDTDTSRINTDAFDSSHDLDAAAAASLATTGALSSTQNSPMSSPTLRSPPPTARSLSPPHHHLHLDQIIEEDVNEKGEEDARAIERYNKELPSGASSMSPGLSPGLSPGSPSETRELLAGRMYNHHHHHHHHHSPHMVAI